MPPAASSAAPGPARGGAAWTRIATLALAWGFFFSVAYLARARIRALPGMERVGIDMWLALATLVLTVGGLLWWTWRSVSPRHRARARRRGDSQWAIAARHFKKNWLAMAGMAVMVALYLITLFTPLVSPYDPAAQGDIINSRYLPPAWRGGGTVEGGGRFPAGAAVRLTAHASPGYVFAGWTRGGSNASADSVYTVVATADTEFRARFIRGAHVTARIVPEGAGSVAGVGTFTRGGAVTVTATPVAGYVFEGWTRGGEQVSASPTYTFTADKDTRLVARFRSSPGVSAGSPPPPAAAAPTRGVSPGSPAARPGEDGTFVVRASVAPPHVMGTDKFGRDILSRVLYGARISLSIGFVAVAISITLGTLIGAVAGYFGGWADSVLMRFTDMMLAFPRLVLLIVVIAVFESPSIWLVVVVLGLTGWMGTSRIVRGEVLSLREREFVQAARALGMGDLRIITRHVIPNTLAPVIVSATLGIGLTILTEASLSFLGLGVQPPTPSWGNMVADGRAALTEAWWIATFPGLAIVLTVVAFNLLGDGLRDALDPRLRT